MYKKQPFVCSHCGEKLPFRTILKVKNGHEFDCSYCGETIVPLKTKSFIWGYVIGFGAFAVPQQAIFYLHQDIVLSFLVGILHAIAAFMLVAIYLYRNTYFKKASSYL